MQGVRGEFMFFICIVVAFYKHFISASYDKAGKEFVWDWAVVEPEFIYQTGIWCIYETDCR